MLTRRGKPSCACPCTTLSITIPTRNPTVFTGSRAFREPEKWKELIHEYLTQFSPNFKKKVLKVLNLDTKSEILTLSCRVTWTGSERVNLCTRRIMTLPRQIKTYATLSGAGPPTGLPSSGNFCRVSTPLPSSALKRNRFV